MGRHVSMVEAINLLVAAGANRTDVESAVGNTLSRHGFHTGRHRSIGFARYAKVVTLSPDQIDTYAPTTGRNAGQPEWYWTAIPGA